MVSVAMSAYLRKLAETNGKLLLIMDIESTWKMQHGGQNWRIAARWDTKNLYEHRSKDMCEFLARMLLIACDGGACYAMDLCDNFEEGAQQWIDFYKEEQNKEKHPVEVVKELTRMDANKPKVI